MILQVCSYIVSKEFDFLNKIKGYLAACFNALNTGLENSFSRGFWGFGTLNPPKDWGELEGPQAWVFQPQILAGKDK